LALACHWRIATRDDDTRLGFPEVKLGLFPGFNGTARSIRQAGALAAMPLMLTGSFIRATAARGMGLIDELAPSPLNLRWMARKAIERKRRSADAPFWKDLARQWPARDLLAKKLRSETAKKVREEHYPAPFRLIDLFEQHAGNLDGMKVAETRAFAPLMQSDTSKNLRRVFKLSEMMKAQAPKNTHWKPLRVHVIGAGTMGADIAGVCVASGMEVSLQDINADQIAKGIAAQSKLFNRKFRTKAQRAAAKARLIADPMGNNIGRADVVIEAIVGEARGQAEPVQDDRGQAEARCGDGDQHLIDHDREDRRAAGRPDAADRPALLQSGTADAAGRGDQGRGLARGRIGQGLHLRHRAWQVPADRQEQPGLPGQPRARPLHDGGAAARREGRGQGEDRRGGACVRHADGAGGAGRYGRPRHHRQRRRSWA
jgi:hypothetical protein